VKGSQKNLLLTLMTLLYMGFFLGTSSFETDFENESPFWKKTNYILKMKAHSITHLENENMSFKKWKVINLSLKKEE
jgi:hypothetical protein